MFQDMRSIDGLEMVIRELRKVPYIAEVIDMLASLDIEYLPAFLGFLAADMEFVTSADMEQFREWDAHDLLSVGLNYMESCDYYATIIQFPDSCVSLHSDSCRLRDERALAGTPPQPFRTVTAGSGEDLSDSCIKTQHGFKNLGTDERQAMVLPLWLQFTVGEVRGSPGHAHNLLYLPLSHRGDCNDWV